MAGLLGKAKGLLTGKANADPGPEPFAVRCTCGERLEGLRKRESQVLQCTQCGAAVFIFPRSPLPAPPPHRRRREQSGRIAPSGFRRPEPARSEAGSREGGKPSREPKPVRSDPGSAAAEHVEELRGIAVETRPPSRIRVILFCMVAMVGLVGYLLARQYERRDLRDNLPERARRGLQLLSEGKYTEARDSLRLAVRALDVLGEPFPEADAVRQGYAEASVVSDLIVEPLDTVIEQGIIDPVRFGRVYRNQSILVDAEVERNPAGDWTIQAPIPVGERFAFFHPSGVKLFADMQIKDKTRVLFGARLGSLGQFDGSTCLQLIPDSGVLLTEPRIIEKLGLGGDADAEKIRQKQLKLVLP